MTMMDSDSESHDSDDGRRFRFEATRKDATVALQARNRGSPHRKDNLAHRSRSRDRSSRDRRDYDRSRYEHNDKDLKNFEDTKKGSKNSSYARNSKTTSNHKDYRESKNSYSKGSKTHDKDQRNSSSRDAKDLKAREVKDSRDRRSREKSRDKSRDRSSISKHRSKCRERHRFHDQGRNHDRFNHTGKVKDCERSRDEQGKCELPRKALRKEERTTSLKQDVPLPNKILDQMGSDSESDLGALDTDIGPVLTLDTQVCREPNLSDFDIVSDLDKNSCDSSDFRAATRGSLVEEEIAASCYKSKVKKHISKQQYERLLKRQATRNRYHLDESCKVNPRNDNHLPSSSNSNPGVISDFLLGTKSSSATVFTSVEDRVNDKEDHRMHPIHREHVSSTSFEGTSNCMDQDSELGRHRSNNVNVSGESVKLNERIAKINYDESPGSRSDGSTITDSLAYGPALPPKYLTSSNVYPSNDIKTTEVLSSCKTEYNELQSEVLLSPRYNDDSDNFKSVHLIGPHFPSTSNNDVKARESTIDSISPSNFKKSRPLNSLSDDKADSLCESASSDWFASDKNSRSRQNTTCIIGPTLPMNQKLNTEFDEEKEEEEEYTFGPILPPYLIQQKKDTSQLQVTTVGSVMQSNIKSFEDEGMIERMESDDENAIGPLPADHPTAANYYVQQQLERRAKRIKDELRKKTDDKGKERELWMTELPPAQAVTLGLGPRKFRAKPGPDMSDRSCWTDTPVDKARKQREKEEERIMHTDEESNRLLVEQRSKKIQEITEERKSKKREESLLEIHQKKLQKTRKHEEKKAKELSKPVRRPFDRDIDLQRNRLNEAQRKSIFTKAQQLDDRFSRGKS